MQRAMNEVRFQNFNYQAVPELPEGVVFFGADSSGVFHQQTRNADPTPENIGLPEAVNDTIALAQELTEEGTSVGFESPSYNVANSTPYARASSMLSSSGGLSFAENIFFFDDERYLIQIQCGSLLASPDSTLHSRRKLQKRLGEMIDMVIKNTF